MRIKILSLALATLFSLSLFAAPPEIHSAWIPEAPPAAHMLAGYLELHNPGDTAIIITGAKSLAFGGVEIHRTEHIDGRARMRKQSRLEVPPGQSLRFEPGGLHLMLMRPDAPLRAGDQVELILITEDKSEYPFTAEVRTRE